jgi:hypothetical protein
MSLYGYKCIKESQIEQIVLKSFLGFIFPII